MVEVLELVIVLSHLVVDLKFKITNSHLYVSLHIMVEANDYRSRRETPSSTNFFRFIAFV